MNKLQDPDPEYTTYLLSFIPHRPDYQEWLYIISAIANTFDESTALQLLKTRFQDEKPNEIEYKIKHRLRNISYGTLVYFAKLYGNPLPYNEFKKSNNKATTYRNTKYRNIPDTHSDNKSIIQILNDYLKQEDEIIYRFDEELLEERASFYEFSANMSRTDADKLIIAEYPHAKKERLYRVAINSNVINKNLNPKTLKPYENHNTLTKCFKNTYCTASELIEFIQSGYAFICAHLKENPDGSTYRKTENFLCAELFAIDIDNQDANKQRKTQDYLSIEDALKIEHTQKALFIYTTCNHSENWHRYRIIFSLPKLIKDIELFKIITSKYINYYGADNVCKNPCTPFFGNNQSKVIVIRK